jgi:hypothetical protein
MHVQNSIYVSFTKYLLHVSALTVQSSARILITSQNLLPILCWLQWLIYRIWNILYVGFFKVAYNYSDNIAS